MTTSKRTIEKRVEEVRRLADAPSSVETEQALRKALADRSNLMVAQAARVIQKLQLQTLVPDLVAAFDRMLADGAATDPQCRGKFAIINTLKALDYSESAILVRGLRHMQWEAVWGGQEDTAPQLRGTCALALVQCNDISRTTMLRHVVDAFTDSAESVRTDAARALGQLEGDDCALLLRLKARMGDEKPRVVGQALESLLQVEGEQAVEFVAAFLESRQGELCEEAGIALASSRFPQALAALKDAWSRERNKPRGDFFLRMIGVSRLPDAMDFLFDLIKEGSDRDAATARKAIEVHQDSPEIHTRLQEALRARGKN